MIINKIFGYKIKEGGGLMLSPSIWFVDDDIHVLSSKEAKTATIWTPGWVTWSNSGGGWS